MAEDDAVEEHEQDQPREQWVRGPVTGRVALVVLPVTLLGAVVAALGPLGDVGALGQAWAWTLLAGVFGVTAAWLVAVMVVPCPPEHDAPGGSDPTTRREYRRRAR